MHEYKKHYKADRTYVVVEYRQDGKQRVVGEDNSCYLEFLASGKKAAEIAYAPPENPDPELLIKNRISRLWIRAKDYLNEKLDPAGLIYCSSKAQAGNEKAIANIAWATNLWKAYYSKKELLKSGQEISYDFSDCGELPYGCDLIMDEEGDR